MALPMRLAGEMVVHQGAAYLRLAPEAAAAAAPQGPAAAPQGPDLDATKPPTHGDIMRNVNSEFIVLHNTRRGLTSDEHRSNITTVQRSLGLPVGVVKGGWNKEAEHRLLVLLRKAKRIRNKVPALMDEDNPIEDGNPPPENNEQQMKVENQNMPTSSSSSSSDSESSSEKVSLSDYERVQMALDEAVAENNEYREDIYNRDIIIKELEEELRVTKRKLAEYESEEDDSDTD
ncbi:unnamed protein product [Symbiodinium sp. CCMP2592]|nr:unnamed protein product [Symbiodinium sp. CCMP2592]